MIIQTPLSLLLFGGDDGVFPFGHFVVELCFEGLVFPVEIGRLGLTCGEDGILGGNLGFEGFDFMFFLLDGVMKLAALSLTLFALLVSLLGGCGDLLIILNTLIILTREKHHCLAELEGMLDVLVGCTENFNSQLIEGVVITLTHLQRIPRITSFDFPLNTHLLCLFAKSLLLRLILQFE